MHKEEITKHFILNYIRFGLYDYILVIGLIYMAK